MKEQSYIYFITNKNGNVLYIGVTTDLIKRIYQHREKLIDGYTKRYNVNKLVYYEIFEDVTLAIQREKELKGWIRDKKEKLIDTMNSYRKDLWYEITK